MKRLLFILITLAVMSCEEKPNPNLRVSPFAEGEIVLLEKEPFVVTSVFSYEEGFSETISVKRVKCESRRTSMCVLRVLPKNLNRR